MPRIVSKHLGFKTSAADRDQETDMKSEARHDGWQKGLGWGAIHPHGQLLPAPAQGCQVWMPEFLIFKRNEISYAFNYPEF